MKRNLIVSKNHLVGKLIIMLSLIIIPACAFLNSFSAQVKVNTINLDGDVFAVVIDGQTKTFTIDTPDHGDISSVTISSMEMKNEVILVVADQNRKYLPEIRVLSATTPEKTRLMLKISEYMEYAAYTTSISDAARLQQKEIGQSALNELNATLESVAEDKLGVIINLPKDFSLDTNMVVYKTPIAGVYYVVSVEQSTEQTDTSTSIITFGNLAAVPPLAEILLEKNQDVSIANLIGLTPEDIADLQSQAGNLSKEVVVFQNQFGESDLENRLTKTQTANLFRYINSVDIVNVPCGSPEFDGKIFAMDPVPGKLIVPLSDKVTLYYCEEVSKEDVKVINLQFAGNPSDCNFATEVKPLDIVLVLDVSGSMQGTKLAVSKSSAINFIRKLNPNMARVGLVSFTSEATVHSDLTVDYEKVIDIIANFNASDGTSISAGLDSAHSVLQGNYQENSTHTILLLSDGYSDYDSAVQSASKIKSEEISILTVGIGAADQGLLSSVASSPDDFVFSNTNQGLREVFDIAALRLLSGGHILARNLVIRFDVNTDQFALVDSMLTNNGKVDAFGVAEWQIPVVYEGQSINLPVALRPLATDGELYGNLEVSYGKCESGPGVSLETKEIRAGTNFGNASTIWSRETIKTGVEKTGAMQGFDSSGWVMDLGQEGVYSVIVEGAGSELPPEIFIGNGKEYLSPLYSIASTTGKMNVFYIDHPKVYWLYLQSNSLSDSGEYSVNIVPGESVAPPLLKLDSDTILGNLDSNYENAYAIEGIGEKNPLTVTLSSETTRPYPRLVSLDGEYSNQLYEVYGDSTTSVFSINGNGPYRLVVQNSNDESTTYRLEASSIDLLTKVEGEALIGQNIKNEVEPQKVDLWEFPGKAGEGIKLTLRILNPEKYEGIMFTVFGPELEQINWSDVESEESIVLRLPEDGKYMIAVQHDYGGNDNETQYGLDLEKVEIPDAIISPISNGDTVLGNLVQGQEDNWLFNAESSEILTIKVTCNDPEAYINIQVLDPAGAPYLNTSGTAGKAQMGPIRLSENGEFTILIDGTASIAEKYQLTFKLE